jgi:hypothetical protein
MCTDVDECEDTVCAQFCKNTPGSFKCACYHGYQLVNHLYCKPVGRCIRFKPISGCVCTDCVLSCCEKFGPSCCHLVTRLMPLTDLLNNLLRAGDIRLVGTTCCECIGLVNLVTR